MTAFAFIASVVFGTVQKDTKRLREAYHRAGVPEYWLVDARGQEIVFQILIWQKEDYVAADKQRGWQWSPSR